MFACGLIVSSTQYGSKDFGLYVISKKHLEAASKMVQGMLRSVLLGAAAGSKDWIRDH